jgi:hypothetical protein
MDSSELLRYATRLLERLGLRYFVTGSAATIFYSEPRFTNDIVLDLPPGRVAELCAAFPADEFYVSEESAQLAVARRGQFNIVHPAPKGQRFVAWGASPRKAGSLKFQPRRGEGTPSRITDLPPLRGGARTTAFRHWRL